MGARAKEIASWLREETSSLSSASLAEAIEQHPYASILHFAYLRSLQNEDSYKFPSQLHRTALSAMDRKALLDWAESPLIPVEVQAAAWKEAQKASQEVKEVEKAPIQVPEVPAAEVPIAAPVSPAPQKPVATSAVPVPTPSKPAAATDLSSINLDALPPAVREQILRSQAIQAQWGKSPAPTESTAPALSPEPKTPTEKSTAVAVERPATSYASPSNPPVAEMEETPAVTPDETHGVPPDEIQEAEVERPVASPAPAADAPVAASELLDSAPNAPVATSVAPPTFAPDPTLSPFANFLAGLKEGVPQSSVPAGQRDPAMERAILEQFLEINPKIKPVRDAPMGENLALRTPNVSGLVTETLANHYYDQGMTEKAIQAYEILKLKVPEKSAIFAARISEMRKTQSSTK
ncbi:MAG TPA: hypothetical protein DCE58_05090 [Cryomorphaceae bacterium]|nr:hypothetical protein [Cryomorphaceae bacterium]